MHSQNSKMDYYLHHVCLSVHLSVCLSICMGQFRSHWMDFHEVLYLSIVFWKSVKKIQEWENFQTKVIDKIKTHTSCSIHLCFWKLYHLWDNVEIYGRARQATDGNIIRYMHIACWITKVTDTHSEYEIGTAFPQQKMLRGHTLMLHLYIHCISCLFLYSAHSFLLGY